MWPKLSVVNYTHTHRGFPGDRVVKIQPASAGHAREAVSIPDPDDLLEKEVESHSSILAGKIPCTLESAGYHSWVIES